MLIMAIMVIMVIMAIMENMHFIDYKTVIRSKGVVIDIAVVINENFVIEVFVV